MAPQKTILSRFGEALRAHRLAKKLTQEQLAHVAGLHRTYVGDLERGKRNPSLKILKKLAQALQLSLSELVRNV